MCGTVVGDQLEFGIAEDEASLVTQSVSVTNKCDKKEVRDKCGIITSVAYYNEMSDITIEGYGQTTLTCGSLLALANTIPVAGAVYVDEVTIDLDNEDYVKTTIRATAYSGIAA